ncbi:MAG: XRE family transcriptional regulator [Campylobacterota bacterium]|nr:XRE family transcriptional regulator [Campylobacterota bacterium]
MFGERLKRARVKAGFSMQGLVDSADNIVTKQSISQYEKDLKSPSSAVLIALANALNVSVEYFFRNLSVNIGEVDFRKQSTFGVTKQNILKEKIREYLERYIELENLLESNYIFSNPLKNENINSFDEIENLANHLRQNWKLGIDPIGNIIEMLELQNIKVLLVDDDKKFSGLCGKVNDEQNHNFIVLNNTQELNNDRKRFTALHELAHLILPKHNLHEEKVSDRFAGAFLFPHESVVNEFGEKRNKISIEELSHVKQKYGISIAAIIYRLRQLDIIDEAMFKRFWIINRTSKFDDKHPYKKEIKTTRFQNLLAHAYSEEFISLSKLAELSGLSVDDAIHKYGEAF